MADAGWYPDPQDARWLQYFDGRQWTGDRRQAAPAAPAAAPAAPAPVPPAPVPPVPVPPMPVPPAPVAPPAPVPPVPVPPGPQAYGAVPGPPAVPGPSATPGYGAVPAGGSWQAAPGWHPPPAPARRRRGRLLLALAAVVLLAAGLTTWLLWPDSPKLTYQGKRIAQPATVLKSAEATVHALVTERHGAENDHTRCYYAQPKHPAPGGKKTDVDSALRCGPVLFVDGDRTKSFLSMPLSSQAKGGAVTLSAADAPADKEPAAVPETVRLVRPDGRKVAAGGTDLAVPAPPAADKDVLTTADLGPVPAPPTLANARMIGKSTGVGLISAGVVPRYGSGDGARSAPAGQQLLAFQLRDERGEVDATTAGDALTVSVGGGRGRAVPDVPADQEYVILAVPVGQTAQLVLDDGGYRQSLSLPAGQPGSRNLAVLTRRHRRTTVDRSATVSATITGAGGSASLTLHATLASAGLDFWAAGHESHFPSTPGNALLLVGLTYTDPGSPGQIYGFDPQLLTLRLSNGKTYSARNIAGAGKIFNVFEVPAGFTSGTLQITGSEQVDGLTLTVTKPVSFPIVIAAG